MNRKPTLGILVLPALLLVAACSPGLTPQGTDMMQAIGQRLSEDEVARARAARTPLAITSDENDTELVPAGIQDDDPVWGPADAPVTIIVFSDFQCPFCGRHAHNVRAIKEKYGELVRVVFKQFPLGFHRQAMPAAQASLAALEQGHFWEMHDKLYDRTDLSGQEVLDWAAEVGLNWEAIQTAVESDRFRDRVEQDMKEGGALGIRGTPASFINGVLVSGAVPIEALEEVVRLGLSRAVVLLNQGTLPENVYATLVGLEQKK